MMVTATSLRLVGDLTYTLALLSSDGTEVASWLNDEGQCGLHALAADLTYMQAAAGGC